GHDFDFEQISDKTCATAATQSEQGLTLEDLGDVALDISIELGRAEVLIEDLLKLREGSVVALDKLAGDPVDIVANGRLVARGELLVIDGKFGVGLSEVLESVIDAPMCLLLGGRRTRCAAKSRRVLTSRLSR